MSDLLASVDLLYVNKYREEINKVTEQSEYSIADRGRITYLCGVESIAAFGDALVQSGHAVKHISKAVTDIRSQNRASIKHLVNHVTRAAGAFFFALLGLTATLSTATLWSPKTAQKLNQLTGLSTLKDPIKPKKPATLLGRGIEWIKGTTSRLCPSRKTVIYVSLTAIVALGILYLHHTTTQPSLSINKASQIFGVARDTLKNEPSFFSFLQKPEIGKCLQKFQPSAECSAPFVENNGTIAEICLEGSMTPFNYLRNSSFADWLTCSNQGFVVKGSPTGILGSNFPTLAEDQNQALEVVNILNHPPHSYLRLLERGANGTTTVNSWGFFGSEMIRTPWQAVKSLWPQTGKFLQADPHEYILDRMSHVSITRIPTEGLKIPGNLMNGIKHTYQLLGKLGGDNCVTQAMKQLHSLTGIELSCPTICTPYSLSNALAHLQSATTYVMRYGKL